MKLKKSSEEGIESSEPVSFRLSKRSHDALKVIAEALEKNKSQVIEEIIFQALEAVERDYGRDIKKAQEKLKINLNGGR